MAFPRNTPRSAFTLVELLVVLGIMALFIGVFATALRPGSPTVAVEGAQSQLASLLTQTRGVALLKGANARLILHADDENEDRYLRFAGIVYDDDPDPNAVDWEPATDGVFLPNGTYVVPNVNPDVAPGVTWNSDLNSNFSANATEGFTYISNVEEEYYFVEFSSNGTVNQGNGSPVIAVSSGQPGADGTGVEFTNPDVTRGAIVRLYGSFVLLNGPDAFPNE